MVNTDKMRQVITSIKDVGITNCTIPSLANIISILNETEIDELIKRSYKIFGCGQTGSNARKLLEEAKPLALLSISNKLRKIKNSQIIRELNVAINNNDLDEFLKNKTTTELGEIKYYIINYLVDMDDENTYKQIESIINKINMVIQKKDFDRKNHIVSFDLLANYEEDIHNKLAV
jgi:hypothetical protein